MIDAMITGAEWATGLATFIVVLMLCIWVPAMLFRWLWAITEKREHEAKAERDDEWIRFRKWERSQER